VSNQPSLFKRLAACSAGNSLIRIQYLWWTRSPYCRHAIMGDRLAFVIKNFESRRRNRTGLVFRCSLFCLSAGQLAVFGKQLVDAGPRATFLSCPRVDRLLPRILAEKWSSHRRRTKAEPPTMTVRCKLSRLPADLGCFVSGRPPARWVGNAKPLAITWFLINQLYQRQAHPDPGRASPSRRRQSRRHRARPKR